MKRILAILVGLVAAVAAAGIFAITSGASPSWSLVGTNVVASEPVEGGGYPVPPGSTKPLPGTCGSQHLNSNHSESWLAVKPGTENLVGTSKFFIGKWSTRRAFRLDTSRTSSGSPSTTSPAACTRTTSTRGGRLSTVPTATARSWSPSHAIAARPSPRPCSSRRRPRRPRGTPTCIPRSAPTARSTSRSRAGST